MKPKIRTIIANYLAKIAGDVNAKEIETNTAEEYYLKQIADNFSGIVDGSKNNVKYTVQSLTASQKTVARQNINAASADVAPTPSASAEDYVLTAAEDGTASWAPLEYEVSVEGATPSFSSISKNTLYLCGELTSLTIINIPDNGIFEIVFVSGSTPTNVILPNELLLPDDFEFDGDYIYDISVRVVPVNTDTLGLAAVQGWPVPSE